MKQFKHFVVAVLLMVLTSCGGSGSYDIVIPAPTVLRTDLLYGYYGGSPQVLEAVGHTNLILESGLFGQEAQLNIIEQAKQPAIIDLTAQVYLGTGREHYFNPNAEVELRKRFQELEVRDLSKYIIGFYPIDEPDLTVKTKQDILLANAAVRKIADEFPLLAGKPLVVIFSGVSRLTGMEDYDWVGFDEYGDKSSILAPGAGYSQLIAKLKPNQKLVIVPGGAFGQNITPFYNYAQTNPLVVAIIPFLWFDQPNQKGIRSNGLAYSYCLAGEQIKSPGSSGACDNFKLDSK